VDTTETVDVRVSSVVNEEMIVVEMKEVEVEPLSVIVVGILVVTVEETVLVIVCE
jgi:hypothetical protein